MTCGRLAAFFAIGEMRDPWRRAMSQMLSSRLRESHICGMSPPGPALQSGDRFRTGWLVAARGMAGPTVQPGDDPGKPSHAGGKVEVLNLLGVTFKVTVCVICETSTCVAADFRVLNICSMIHLWRSSAIIAGAMHRVGRVGHALLGPSVALHETLRFAKSLTWRCSKSEKWRGKNLTIAAEVR
jgi:hypothetical protein